ncbi:MAG: glycoside hydrolase family 2 TIM barrel-domain containing protein, partial [Verrucomicrobiota bacterium]
SVQDMVDYNINHTRQKWVTEDFLDDCDRLGVYVTDENPVDFAKNPVASDPKFLPQYMSLMADLVERDRDHPSIIMWGLDNESDYGSNVEPTYKYVRAEDPQRLTQFSWASHVPVDKELPYDVYSFHYPPFDGDLASYGNSAFNSHSLVRDRQPQPVIPVIADEYAHLPIYDPDELRRDPNVHNFWGESIKLYWEKMFVTDGALGGDIFGLRGARGDLPPEYWLIKKAYAPVRVDNQTLTNPGAGKPLKITVKNWFDHTNVKELKVHWSVGGESGDIAGPDVAPHADGKLEVPARNWRDGDVVSLKFQRADGLVVQESALPVSPVLPVLPTPQGPAPQITQDQNGITIAGKDFSLVFSKQTGLITSGDFQGTEVIESGPYLHIVATDRGKTAVDLPPWSLKRISTSRGDNEAVVRIAGNYGAGEINFELHIDGTGLITAKYELGAFPFTSPAAHPNPWNDSHYGGFSEVGISFVLTNAVDRLAWNRKALWSFYPEDHIGRGVGIAQRAVASGSWAQGGGGGRGGRSGFG